MTFSRLNIAAVALLLAAPALAQGVNPQLKPGSLAPSAAAANLGFVPLNPANNLSELTSQSAARANLGLGALATQDTLGVGGVTSSMLATGAAVANLGNGGRVYNLRGDFAAACDGATDDTMPLNNALTALGGSTTPVTLTFPGTCLISYAAHTIAGALSFEGVNGGGLKLAAGSSMASTFLTWSNASSAQVSIKNFTMDMNGAASAGVAGAFYFAPTRSVVMDHSNIINAAAPGVGYSMLLVQGYGLTSASFTNNYFQLASATPNQNQCINLGNPTYPSSNITITGNRCLNTAVGVFGVGDNVNISGNVIDGWGFGGGITFEQNSPQDTVLRNATIANNIIKNSGAYADINNTWLNGIENSYYGVNITGNVISKTCGSGIGTYGSVNITNNVIFDVGTCNHDIYTRSGIVTAFPNGYTENGSYSYINGNTVYDDGSGNTAYGYSDVSSITGVVFGVNNFQGSLGAYNIVGGAEFLAAQKDNRVINPCGQIDQRNEGAAVVSGFVTDQWQMAASHGYITQQRIATKIGGCGYAMRFNVSTQFTPLATDYLLVKQNIPYADVQDFQWGTSLAKDAIFAFCASMNTAPPFTGSWTVQNINATWSYSGSYTITALANNAQCFSFKIPANSHSLGPTTNAISLVFDLGSGSSNKTSTANTWQGNYWGLTTATSLVSLPVGTQLTLSNVRFLPASADLGWAPRLFTEELLLAQRYYRKSFPQGTKPAQNAGTAGAACVTNPIANGQPSIALSFPPMWGSPTVTTYNPSAANANWRDTTASSDVAVSVPATATSAGGVLLATGAAIATLGDLACLHYTLDAGL